MIPSLITERKHTRINQIRHQTALEITEKMKIAAAGRHSLIFLFMFSERSEGKLLSDGLLFPLDVI